jgi:hypothetical protein
VVESSGLLNRRRGLNLYRGFESLPLRHLTHQLLMAGCRWQLFSGSSVVAPLPEAQRNLLAEGSEGEGPGDEDGPRSEPSLFLKRAIPGEGLVIFSPSGDTNHLMEPELCNRSMMDFLPAVERGIGQSRKAVLRRARSSHHSGVSSAVPSCGALSIGRGF